MANKDKMPDESSEKMETRRKGIARFSESVLNAEVWFHTADELIVAMKLLEPQVKRYWDPDPQIVDQKSEVPRYAYLNVASVHMMLAGFAIENLCKGYLAGRLSPKEREEVKAGVLPKSLKSHHILNLIEQTGMILCVVEKYLVVRLTEAVLWLGRYPSATSHEWFDGFALINCDIEYIETLLEKLRRHVGAKDRQHITA